MPVFGEDRQPLHDRGVVGTAPGLYFMGLLFQYAETSDVLPGVGRDAEHVAKHIARFGASNGGNATAPHGLTQRELDVIRLVAEGNSNRDVAFPSRTAAAAFAFEHGLA